MQSTRYSNRFPSVFLIVAVAMVAVVPAVRVFSTEKRHAPQRVVLVAPGSESNVAGQLVIGPDNTSELRALIASDSSRPDPQAPLPPTAQLREIDVMHVGRIISAIPVAEKGGSVSSRAGDFLQLGDACDCDEDCDVSLGDQCNIVQCIVRSTCTGDAQTPCTTDNDCDGNGSCNRSAANFVQRCDTVQLIGWSCESGNGFCAEDRCEDDGTGTEHSICLPQTTGPVINTTLSPCPKQCVGGPAAGLRCDISGQCPQGDCVIKAGGLCDEATDACYVGPSVGNAIGRCCTVGICTETTQVACGGSWLRYTDPEQQEGDGQCICPKYGSGVAPNGVDAGSIGPVRPSGLVCQIGSQQTTAHGQAPVYCEDPDGDGLAPQFCHRRCVGGDKAGAICQVDFPDCALSGICSVSGGPCLVAQGGSDCPAPGGQSCDPTNPGACLDDPCAANDIEGGCEDGFLNIGDDYDISNGSFQRLTQFRFRGGVTKPGEDMVIEFWDSTGTKLVDAFAINNLPLTGTHDWTIEVDCWPNCNPNQQEVPLQRPIIIPPVGWVVMRSTRTIGTIDGAAAFWSQTDSPSDVGVNDVSKMWIDGDPNASLGSNVMIFELVGIKVPAPHGACCDDALSCEDTLRWECGICTETDPAVLCASTIHDCPQGGLGGGLCQFNRWFGPISHTDFEFGSADLTLCNGVAPCDSGACCDGESCTVTTEGACAGDFQGIATDCAPNCCPVDFSTGSDCACETSTCVVDAGATNTGFVCDPANGDADCGPGQSCVLRCVPAPATQLSHPFECHDDFGSPLKPPISCDPTIGDADCPPIPCTNDGDCPFFGFCDFGFCADTLAMTCDQSFTTSVTVTKTDTIDSFFGVLDGDACSLNTASDRIGWFERFTLVDPTPGDGTDDCFVVTVSMCCTDPVLTSAWPFVSSFRNCPCVETADVIGIPPDSDLGNNLEAGFGAESRSHFPCEDGNYSATFTLPPGEYAYQINADKSCVGSTIPCDTDNDCPGSACVAPNPDYTVHLTVESCQIAACCVGETCIATNKLDCAAQGGNFPGTIDQPIVGCFFPGTCTLGSCCVDGTCNDDAFHDELAECEAQDGVYRGGVSCDTAPCPACPFDSPQNCRQVQTIFGAVPLMDRNPENGSSNGTFGTVLTDDVKFGGSQVDNICWNTGFFATPCCDESCTQNTDDSWEIRVYETDPNCDALPGPEVGMSTITVLNKVEGTGQGTATWHYSGSVNTPIALPNGGLAGDTYWFEVSAFGEPGCEVRATWSRDHGNEHYVAAQIASVNDPRAYNLAGIGDVDVGFCENSGIATPNDVLGSCCTCPGNCQDNLTQRECKAIRGAWLACATCAETPCPGPPANDDCEAPFLVSNVPIDGGALIVVGENICATDDGPGLSSNPSTGGCSGSLVGGADMHNDGWYSYVAEACGALTIEGCGAADMDQMIAVYDASGGCPTSEADELGCGDDDCGLAAGPATVTVPVFFGQALLIRVGGWNDEVPGGFHGDPRGSYEVAFSLTGSGPCCKSDDDCDDGESCNGEETCDTETGQCQPGIVACEPGSSCTCYGEDGECLDGTDDATGETNPVYLFSGEKYESVVDMRIPGRGNDFVWSRKYRSRIGPDTAIGNGWDFSYNIRLEPFGPDLLLGNGSTRRDKFRLQPNGTWTRREFFRVIEQNPDGSLTLTHSDTGRWEFQPFDGSPHEGKITASVDRNGNTIRFDYDGLGRLVTIHDSLDTPAHNRDITIAYNADGFIESVTDFAGRSVTYTYYGVGGDVCSPEPAAAPHNIRKNRYISIRPCTTSLNAFDLRLTLVSSLVNGVTAVGSQWWANAPDADCISIVTATRPAGPPDWSACTTVHLAGCPIIPTSTYDIVAIDEGMVSNPLSADTQAKPDVKWHGDCVGFFTGTEWTAPNGQTSIDDAVAAIKTFQNPDRLPGCPAPPCNATHTSVTDMVPNLTPGPQINKIVNIADVFSIILGFQGQEYPGPQIELCPDSRGSGGDRDDGPRAGPGGSFGDLKSVTTPAVINSPEFPIPAGHDYPNGKTTTYTYSTGFADDRLNHNLLTITDPKGQTYLQTEYYPTTNPFDLNFDRVKRQTWGDPGDVIDIVYVRPLPSAELNFATIKAILNDRVGNVKEFFYDGLNRNVITREYTGRADPDLPTTESDNRPTGKLRPGDPDVFEKRYEYNFDSLRKLIVDANENVVVPSYDESNASRRSQGNMTQRCRQAGPLGGDQTQICESYEYDDNFGGCCGTNFITRHVDGRGNETLHTYDANGNRLHTQHRIPSIVEDFEYNQFGQMTAHVHPDNGNAHRRRDEYTYYDSGPQLGYLHQAIVDAPNFALTTTYEYNLVGQAIRSTDPRGHDTQDVVNQLDQTVRRISREVTDGSGVRYETDSFYDPNDNVVRVDIQNRDDQGVLQANTHFTTVYEYEILNYQTRTCEEVGEYTGAILGSQEVPLCTGLPDSEFLSTEHAYDANRNPTLMRYGEAVEGRQPANIVQTLYDERDLTFRKIRAPGDSDQSTTQYDYDDNRNITRTRQGLEDTPRVTIYTYDGYDRPVTSEDPMGNVRQYQYDANHNVVSHRTDGELVDLVGSAGNVRLTEETFVYDELDRIIREEVEFFDTATQTPIQGGQQLGKAITVADWSDNSQITRAVNDNLHQTLTAYDTADRRSVVTDHLNNTLAYTYDDNSNVTAMTEVEKSDLGDPDEEFTTAYAYDNLDRLIQTVDNVGNTHIYAHDSRDNQTFMDDSLSHETRYVYDGINRLITTIRDLDGDSDGDGQEADPDEPADIFTTQAWDDTSRLTGQGDDNGNITTYAYDALNRMTAEVNADTTVHAFVYDVHDNKTQSTDANGSVSTSAYDLYDRMTDKTIAVGAGVSTDITFEDYKYDGLSRLIHAEDDDSVVTQGYDSLSRVTRETLNGQTTTCVYDGVGNELASTYPGGRTIACTFDGLERKSTIADGGGMIAAYDYVGPDRVERREYGNGTRTDYTYDGITGIPNPADDFGVKRIIGTTHSVIAGGAIIDDRTYTWDKMYNKLQRDDTRAGGPQFTHDYEYDAIYRLLRTTVTNPLAVVLRDTTYDLDGVGNRATVAGAPDPGPHVGVYTMDATQPAPADFQVNQYTTTSTDARVYDENGNLFRIDDGLPTRRDIEYDYRNQMVDYFVVATGVRHTYAYDALGRRIARVLDADAVQVETRYFYDGWQVCEEQDQFGLMQATYVYGLYIDEVLNMQRASADFYYHTDDLYNVMALTNAAAVVVERYEYADYGRPLDPSSLSGSVAPSLLSNPYLFTGRRYGPETGWYHYRTRYLDSVAGRFTTRDVIGLWGDLANLGNPYTYVRNNPATWTDPYGLGAGKVEKRKPVKAPKKPTNRTLVPGSPEAKRADADRKKKAADKKKERAERKREKDERRRKQEEDRKRRRGVRPSSPKRPPPVPGHEDDERRPDRGKKDPPRKWPVLKRC